MVTKIKPRRIKSDNPGSLGDFLGYQDESKFSWGQGGSGQGNVKAFYLSGTSDLTTAQAAYDRYDNGKEPIIVYGGETYIFSGTSASSIIFSSITTAINGNTEGLIERREVEIKKTGGVYSISTAYFTSNFLDTNIDYILPYTPQYNGSPTTKKYVDDKDTYIGTSAPSNPVEGRLRYDTANDQLKVYDGTNRNNVNTQVTVEDNLTSTSTTNALSANQGRILNGKIADLMALGKFLSLWNASTGQPISFPYTTPYAYTTGDYYLVSTVSSATPPVNYRPTGSSYTGTASSTAETDELEVGDVYIYDGSVWLLQSNHGKTVTFANIAGQPTDNTNLATALGNKQDTLSAGTGISISSNTVTNTGVTSVNGSTGAVTIAESNTKTFYLSSTSDLTTAQAVYDRWNAGKDAIVVCQGTYYYYWAGTAGSAIHFVENGLTTAGSVSNTDIRKSKLSINFSSDVVSSITIGEASFAKVLATDVDYSPAYTPLYDGSPATKKYVDDKALPAVGTNGQVLTVVSGAAAWANAPATGIQNDTTGTTTTVTKIRAGTSTEYSNLGTYDSSTIYHIY